MCFVEHIVGSIDSAHCLPNPRIDLIITPAHEPASSILATYIRNAFGVYEAVLREVRDELDIGCSGAAPGHGGRTESLRRSDTARS